MRSAVILAGGAGSRLGKEKSLIEFDGRPLIQWSVEKLTLLVEDVVVVARGPEQASLLEDLIPQASIACDRVSGYGPVAGLAVGMGLARNEYVLAIGCDLPFLNADVVNILFEQAQGWDAAVPMRENGMIEPLHSVYKRDALLFACQKAMEHGERKIRAPLSRLRVKCVAVELLKNPDPELLTFFNLNTREDLDLARCLWPKR
ncbi:Molybdenum cofactor guanylyltransferase [uncultured archaeon]|nr:Molybdenum cofactor guanylyltransferase [uncultured archaeon]